MIHGLTSIIIPTFEHAHVLSEAIESALAQTAPVEVIAIDDGSTDNTREVMESFAGSVRPIALPHSGLGPARNAGIESATGEFVMFLDADDVIAPSKVAEQIDELSPATGWSYCDIRIERPDGQAINASENYEYSKIQTSGWLAHELAVRNFIPVHAPLYRRSAIGDIRFDENKLPEDYHFLYAVASLTRAVYVPKVLGTYRKSRNGRSSSRHRGWATKPYTIPPLRLNLACGTKGNDSWHPLPGLLNLDKSLGWSFEEGLQDYASGSVAGITESHGLMYVALRDWPAVFAEFARVLEPGGVIRITEDETTDQRSKRYGGWKGSQPGITLTSPALVREHLERGGLTVRDVTAATTHYRDDSLKQAFHGAPPEVFFIEGVREKTLLLSPHADDESLFAAFHILRHRPRVVICFPSGGDYGDTAARTAESRAAVDILGGGPVEQWDGTDLVAKMRAVDDRFAPSVVIAPTDQASHPEHVAVARAAAEVFGDRLRVRYHTYDFAAGGKVRDGEPVAFEQGWAERKRAALACYRTQIEHPRAGQFFEMDLAEYQAC